MNKKEEASKQNYADNSSSQNVKDLFEDDLQFELFRARGHDTGDSTTSKWTIICMFYSYISFYNAVENAKIFKEEFLKRNVKIQNGLLNLQGMRLGINSIMALSNCVHNKQVEKLNLADNSISDYGMHAIKKILKANKLKSLNLASNMVSGEGLELFLDDLIEDKNLKNLDLGVVEGSMRKNSLGIQGAVCLSALLIKNRIIDSLSINDNDLGPDGGECIGIALSQNETLKHLKIGENDLKSEGAIPVIKSASNLQSLSLAKNFMKADVGKPLAKLLKHTVCLQKLSLEFNELQV